MTIAMPLNSPFDLFQQHAGLLDIFDKVPFFPIQSTTGATVHCNCKLNATLSRKTITELGRLVFP
jgi:hypothetical protein